MQSLANQQDNKSRECEVQPRQTRDDTAHKPVESESSSTGLTATATSISSDVGKGHLRVLSVSPGSQGAYLPAVTHLHLSFTHTFVDLEQASATHEVRSLSQRYYSLLTTNFPRS